MRFRAWLGVAPVIAGVFGAATIGCGSADRPPTAESAADSADQVIFGLTQYLTIDGVRRVRLQADTAYFYQVPQRAALRHVHVTFYSPDGVETSNLTAMRGTYDWRTENMEARDDVVAVTPDHRRLTTSVLQYDRATDKIQGDQPFVFVTPERRLEGKGFTSDPDFKNVVAGQPKGTVGQVELNKH